MIANTMAMQISITLVIIIGLTVEKLTSDVMKRKS